VENIQVIALIAIAISLVSIGLVVANVLNFQTSLMSLNTAILEQTQAARQSGQAANSTQQEISVQGQKLSQMEDAVSNLTSEARSLEGRVASLEERVSSLGQEAQHPCQIPQGCTQAAQQPARFVPLSLRDKTGTLWTSWFIKESLYYPTLYSTSCDAPGVDCYVHFSNISTPDGQGIEADTAGAQVYGYWFLGYSQEFTVPQNGTVTVSGNFLKNNTFGQIPGRYIVHPLSGIQSGYGMAIPSQPAPAPAQNDEGRNHIYVFILDRDPNMILAQKQIVFAGDNNTTWYHRSVTFSLPPGQVFRVGIGAENNWAADYGVYVAWNGVNITASQAWSPLQ